MPLGEPSAVLKLAKAPTMDLQLRTLLQKAQIRSRMYAEPIETSVAIRISMDTFG